MGLFDPPKFENEIRKFKKEKETLDIPVTTTDFIPGKTVKEIKGLVISTGLNRSQLLFIAHEVELAKMAKEQYGANAVIGVVATTHSGGVTALVGTAVVVE